MYEHGNTGRTHSKLTRNKISDKLKGRVVSAETKEKISNSKKDKIKVWISQEEYLWL